MSSEPSLVSRFDKEEYADFLERDFMNTTQVEMQTLLLVCSQCLVVGIARWRVRGVWAMDLSALSHWTFFS